MMKECFSLKSPDPQKFRECATCPIAAECVQTVYLGEARCVDKVARVLGFLLGAFGLLFAVVKWGDIPNGAPWLLLVSAVYLVAVHGAAKEYAVENEEAVLACRATAESGPTAQPSEAHH